MNHFYYKIDGWFNFEDLYSNAVQSFNGEKGVFVEVGTWLGKSLAFLCVEIINSNKNIDLYSVDTWMGSPHHADLDIIKNNALYKTFLDNIAPIRRRMNIMKSTSIEAAKQFENESIDFLFLDASHKYKDVLDDLNAWYGKLKKGATFAGHDYRASAVSRAVNEFCSSKNITPHPTSESSWYFIIK